MGRKRTWLDAELVAAVASSTSITEVLRKLGLRVAGGTHNSIKQHMLRLGIVDTLTPSRRESCIKALRRHHEKTRKKPEDVYVEHSKKSGLRRCVLRHKAILYVCEDCGNDGNHRGMPLSLQLHHKNGDITDSRLANLCFLCPNCHSQTSNFAGQNNKRHCLPDGQKSAKFRAASRLVDYDSVLKAYYEVGNACKVAADFNVSEAAIRRIVRRYGKGDGSVTVNRTTIAP